MRAWISWAKSTRRKASPSPVAETAHVRECAHVPAPKTAESPTRAGGLPQKPPVLVAADDTPIPYAEPLERAWIPDADRIAEEVRRTLKF